jgi:hypothetical protein
MAPPDVVSSLTGQATAGCADVGGQITTCGIRRSGRRSDAPTESIEQARNWVTLDHRHQPWPTSTDRPGDTHWSGEDLVLPDAQPELFSPQNRDQRV